MFYYFLVKLNKIKQLKFNKISHPETQPKGSSISLNPSTCAQDDNQYPAAYPSFLDSEAP